MTSICEPTAYGASFPMNSHPLLGLAAANLGPFLMGAELWLGHESHEFPSKWLPSLGTCPKATWMTSICEPTAYGASFPMNSLPLAGPEAAANLGPFLHAHGPWLHGHESMNFPPKWLPTLGTCPKATWMTSICEPTAYGASFPMNSHPLTGL